MTKNKSHPSHNEGTKHPQKNLGQQNEGFGKKGKSSKSEKR